jgi:thiamine-phosphate pyrophosphorylase
MRKLQLGPLYPITISDSESGTDHLRLAREYLKAGIHFFQVRDKQLSDRIFYQCLLQIRQISAKVNAEFLVNDRVDLALASGAAGVHLGQTDLPAEEARRILGEQAVIGISTHDRKQFLKAQTAPVNYVALGPIFETSTKKTHRQPLGVNLLRDLASERKLPLVAIGGIRLENAVDVWKAGADSIAVISDIAATSDPAFSIQKYLDKRSQC